ncbi:MAG: hypothetical protein IK026_03305 [Eubacteriaceae bacterium]|nr:hypothetical protein [Eubacteriaceae bacterium]
MSLLTRLVYGGTEACIHNAQNAIVSAIEEYGARSELPFRKTAYSLPIIYALTGIKCHTLEDLLNVLEDIKKNLPANEADITDDTKDGLEYGLTALMANEITAYCCGLADPATTQGFIPDYQLRKIGFDFCSLKMYGVYIISGVISDEQGVNRIAEQYLRQGAGVFVPSAIKAKYSPGHGSEWVLPCGENKETAFYAVSALVRMAMMFGSVAPGDKASVIRYIDEKAYCCANVFGELNSEDIAVCAGLITLGIPVLANAPLGECVLPGSFESESEFYSFAERSVKINGLPEYKRSDIPVGTNDAFRFADIADKETVYAAGTDIGRTWAMALTRLPDRITDRMVETVGSERFISGKIDEHLFIMAEICGEKLNDIAEAVIERKIPEWIDSAEGVSCRIVNGKMVLKVSNTALRNGFTPYILGRIVYDGIKAEFGGIVDKAQISVISDEEKVGKLIDRVGRPKLLQTDDKTGSIRDDNCDRFYICAKCSARCPGRYCVITPSRQGECGRIDYITAMTSYRSSEKSGFQEVSAEFTDKDRGICPDVNRALKDAAGTQREAALYDSVMPGTPQIPFAECYAITSPDRQGIIIAYKDYDGTVPGNIASYDEAAHTADRGETAEGIEGVSADFLVSGKFMNASGGVKRIIWMPKSLKDRLGVRLDKISDDGNFSYRVSDETRSTDFERIAVLAGYQNHPAYLMEKL